MTIIKIILKENLILSCYLQLSLVYEIKTEKDVYEDFDKGKDLFDFCKYPKDSMFYHITNKNEIGKMKDESEGKINNEFVGLKSKMYSMKDVHGKENKT